jgi:hypothetical protein
LLFDAGNIGGQNFLREQLALLGFAAGVADGAGRAASERNWMMAKQLETAQRQQWDHAAHVQTVGRGIKAGIDRNRPFADAFGQRLASVQSATRPRHWSSSRMFIGQLVSSNTPVLVAHA